MFRIDSEPLSAGNNITMLYGTGIVLIILIGTLLSDLTQVKDSCFWMCVSAAVITPITWEDPRHFRSI